MIQVTLTFRGDNLNIFVVFWYLVKKDLLCVTLDNKVRELKCEHWINMAISGHIMHYVFWPEVFPNVS